MDEVWDPHWFGPTKTLDVHISWLRKKIEDDRLAPDVHHDDPRGRVPIPSPGRRTLGGRSRRFARGSSSPFAYILVVVILALGSRSRSTSNGARPPSSRTGPLIQAQGIAAQIGTENIDDPERLDPIVNQAPRSSAVG